jgi:hypothetical protein
MQRKFPARVEESAWQRRRDLLASNDLSRTKVFLDISSTQRLAAFLALKTRQNDRQKPIGTIPHCIAALCSRSDDHDDGLSQLENTPIGQAGRMPIHRLAD